MKINLFYIFLVMTIMSSCVHAVCPGYDMENYLYITFRKNDTIRYYSYNTTVTDSLVFRVVDFYKNEPYEFYSYPDYDCFYDVYYKTNEVDGIFVREHLEGMSMEVQIGDDVYLFDLIDLFPSDKIDTVALDYSVTCSFVMIDSTKFNYYTLQDLTGNRRFDSFTKMEYRGIVEFHDKQTGKLWKMNR